MLKSCEEKKKNLSLTELKFAGADHGKKKVPVETVKSVRSAKQNEKKGPNKTSTAANPKLFSLIRNLASTTRS